MAQRRFSTHTLWKQRMDFWFKRYSREDGCVPGLFPLWCLPGTVTSWLEIPTGELRLRTLPFHVLGLCSNPRERGFRGAGAVWLALHHRPWAPAGRARGSPFSSRSPAAPHPRRVDPEGRGASPCRWLPCQRTSVWAGATVRPERRSAGAPGEGLLALKINTRQWAAPLPLDTVPCEGNFCSCWSVLQGWD